MCFTVTMRSLVIAALWTCGIAIAVLAAVYPVRLSALAIAFMLAAATLSIRGYIAKYAADWEAAYDAGREVTRLRQGG